MLLLLDAASLPPGRCGDGVVGSEGIAEEFVLIRVMAWVLLVLPIKSCVWLAPEDPGVFVELTFEETEQAFQHESIGIH